MAFGLCKIKSVENTFCIWIPDWGTLTGHIWKEYDSVTARIDFFCNLIELIQRRCSCLFLHHSLIIGKFTFKPAHHSAATGRSALQKPFTRNDMIPEDQSWICFVFINADAHSTCLSALFLCFSRMNDTCTQSSTGCIQTTCYNRGSFRESALCGCFCCHGTYDMVTFADLRQKFHRNSEVSTHLFVPASLLHIETVKAVSLRHILCDRACQLKGDKTVGLEDLVDLFINLRKIFFVPDDLCCRIRRLK